MSECQVLVVDDLLDVRATLSGILLDAGFDVYSASSRVEALQILGAEQPHVAVLDVRLDDTDESNQDGLLLMREIRERYPSIAIIILTGYADVKMVREALQPDSTGVSPAFGFLEKSEMDQLVHYVKRAYANRNLAAISVVRSLIAQGENDRLEFKSSIRWDLTTKAVNKNLQEAIAIAITGMLNGQGGTLLIGVADDGAIVGIENDMQTLRKKDIDGFQLALTDIVKSYLGIEYMTCIHAHFDTIDGKCICMVSIDKSPTPVFFTMGQGHAFWVRMGNSTRSLDIKAATNYIQLNWKKEE